MTSHSDADSENGPEVPEPESEIQGIKVRWQRPIKATNLEKD